VPTRSWIPLIALASLACGGHSAASAPENVRPEREPVKPLPTVGMAGQSLAVTPLTLLVRDEALSAVPELKDRATALAWADSLVGEALLARAPEVKWVLPADLRKIARRSPTVAPDPDRMGQSLLRAPNVKDIPDPLRASLRSLMALAGGRLALVPAALAFVQEPDGRVRAELSLALADSRTGKVVWRTLAWGVAPTAEQALRSALNTVFPVALGLR